MIMIKHATYVDILIWGSAIFLTFYLSGFLKNGALLQLIGALLSIFAIIMLLNTAITKSNKKK